MTRETEGVTLKNGGRGATRGSKGRVVVQNRGRFGFDFSVAVKDPKSTSGVRVLYMSREDAYDMADALDVVLSETESK
jgi:hypothetical protein